MECAVGMGHSMAVEVMGAIAAVEGVDVFIYQYLGSLQFSGCFLPNTTPENGCDRANQ